MADLKKNGQKGTPITPETFAAWQEKKRKRKAEKSRVSYRDKVSTSELLIIYANKNFSFPEENGGARDAEEKRWKRIGCFVWACPL